MDAKVLMGMARVTKAVEIARNREADKTPEIDADAARILDTHHEDIDALLRFAAAQMARR